MDSTKIAQIDEDLDKFKKARATARANGEWALFHSLTEAIDRLENVRQSKKLLFQEMAVNYAAACADAEQSFGLKELRLLALQAGASEKEAQTWAKEVDRNI